MRLKHPAVLFQGYCAGSHLNEILEVVASRSRMPLSADVAALSLASLGASAEKDGKGLWSGGVVPQCANPCSFLCAGRL